MEVDLVAESVKFMFLGMGIVYLFLTLMIYVLKLQSFLILEFFSQVTDIKTIQLLDPRKKSDNEGQIAAVITAAIMHYKK